jgi:hypothetical protein
MQLGYVFSEARENFVVAGRRSFKTEAAKRRVVKKAISFHEFSDGHFFATAPTQSQAEEIFWKDLKAMSPTWALAGQDRDFAISDGKHSILYGNGALLRVAGLDKPQRIEGVDWDGGVVTEFGNCHARILDEIIRPMMMRGGWIDIEGVPEGRNHYFDRVNEVRDGKRPRALLHEWTTEEVLHLWLGEERAAEEIEDARTTMDPRTYQQEMLAVFVALEGMAYYAYDEDLNHDEAAIYRPDLPLIVCLDFNRNPGVCSYLQEVPVKRLRAAGCAKPLRESAKGTATCAIGEVWIPRNSDTRQVSRQVALDWGDIHKDDVILHGDATGGAKTTQSMGGSDWQIVEDVLRPVFGHRLKDRVPRSNPPVRLRVNSMNTRLVAADGSVGFLLNPRTCRHLTRDLEGVETDDAGEILKEKGSPLTHISDGVGYYVHEDFPCGGGDVTVTQVGI